MFKTKTINTAEYDEARSIMTGACLQVGVGVGGMSQFSHMSSMSGAAASNMAATMGMTRQVQQFPMASDYSLVSIG